MFMIDVLVIFHVMLAILTLLRCSFLLNLIRYYYMSSLYRYSSMGVDYPSPFIILFFYNYCFMSLVNISCVVGSVYDFHYSSYSSFSYWFVQYVFFYVFFLCYSNKCYFSFYVYVSWISSPCPSGYQRYPGQGRPWSVQYPEGGSISFLIYIVYNIY